MRKWQINRILTIQEREMLLLIAESNGINVYRITREHTYKDEHPYLTMNGGSISGFAILNTNYEQLSYEEALNIVSNGKLGNKGKDNG